MFGATTETKISKDDLSQAKSRLKKVYPDFADVNDQELIAKFIKSVPVAIVEYEGTLAGEDTMDAEKRRRLDKIYDNWSVISSYLRGLYTKLHVAEKTSLNKWELIFTVYNEIMGYQNVVSQVLDEAVLGSTETTETPQNEEQVVSNSSSVEETGKVEDEVIAPAEPENNPSLVSDTDTKNDSSNVSTGNAKEQDDDSLFNTSNNDSIFKEETRMKNIEDLKKAAQVSTKVAAEAAEKKANSGKKTLSPAQKDQKKLEKKNQTEKENKIIDALRKTQVERQNYTQNTTVTAIVAYKIPAWMRATEDHTGVLQRPVNGDADGSKRIAKLYDKATNFARLVSGDDKVDFTTWVEWDDEKKFAKVYGGRDDKDGAKKALNTKIAQAMADNYAEALSNPDKKFIAVVPKTGNITGIKGYRIQTADGTQMLSTTEFMNVLINRAFGMLYAEGELDSEGRSTSISVKNNKEVKDPQIFALRKANKKNQSGTGQSKKEAATTATTVTIGNKKKFVDQKGHVLYCFEKTEPTANDYATFRVNVSVDGKDYPAAVPCVTKEIAGPDGKIKYETKTASQSVSIPVIKLLTDADNLNAEVKGDMDTQQLKNVWKLNVSAVSENDSDLAKISDMSAKNNRLIRVLASLEDSELTNGLLGDITKEFTAEVEAKANMGDF